MAAIPVDIKAYEKIAFFGAEPAVYDDEAQFDNETGDPIYNMDFAVAIQGRFRRETEVISVRVVYPKNKNPQQDLDGRPVQFVGLKATPRLAGQNKNILAISYSADSVSAVGPVGRPETKPTA
ncbi:hypothetical protein [Tsukamurella tyrosinosolvens]|uniref:hypothetical protein n=1 Tax=Tsukamurella tyrosinosolvens TaxID=57704 RepID=UPI002DD44F00|nr:hypothetical protein [Tsukamurella tyrosinosolvens]MEC4612908.1 hypothetical protein [Tsukamurella tyrosinosolvens]